MPNLICIRTEFLQVCNSVVAHLQVCRYDVFKKRMPQEADIIALFSKPFSALCERRGLQFLFAALTPICLAACSISSQGLAPDQYPAEPVRLIETVPFFPQEQYQCGPAAMASILNYRGLKITPDEIAAAIYSKSARGTLNMDMILFAEKKGMRTRRYSGGLDDLKRRINESNPLIVLVDYGFLTYQKNHFMVVVGYGADHVIVHSGKDRFKSIPNDDFLKSWKRTKYWTLLIQKEEGGPA